MTLYCGIDLHSRDSWLAILDDGLEVIGETKVGNDLETILRVLEPHREALAGVAVESTFNWYWLVDGLMDAGHRVHLTNTWAVKQYEGLKYTDDRHDARWLAHLLALGILPEGYIYPKEERSARDLMRRRSFLVRKRTSFILAMRGAFECRTGMRVNSNDLKKWKAEDVMAYVEDPMAAFGITCLLEPMHALSAQIKKIEKAALSRGKLRPEFVPLETVWGIGKILALTIMYEVGDVARFRKVGNFTSYCRLVNTARLSAGKRKGSGNRKNGNPYLSWAFSEAAHHAVRHYPEAQKYFQRKRAKTNGIIAIRALAHKLARASYHVMRDHVDFDPEKTFG
ncbi:MAG: IS110 family transposase [Acidobacteria bacterium]|nr:IS110 family transposase [Candidatus Sulfomarinibacter sp. MAG AM2]